MLQLGELTAGHIMTDGVATVSADDLLSEAIQFLDTTRFHVLPVVDSQGKLTGILSIADLLGIFYEIQTDLAALKESDSSSREFLIQLLTAHGDDTHVRDVMTAPVRSIKRDTNSIVAARMLQDHRCHHLPVVDEQDQPIGMVSTIDFVRAFAEHGALLAG